MFSVYPQHPLSHATQATLPVYTIVFIGGFCDKWLGLMSKIWEHFQYFDPETPWAKAYYHWDGDGGGLLNDQNVRIVNDLNAWIQQFPRTHLLLIGHSYGGSTAMEVLRKLGQSRPASTILVTLDAVSRRQKTNRAPRIDWWVNTYLSCGGGLLDIVPRIGGRWGMQGQADLNLAFNGLHGTAEHPNTYSHRAVWDMLFTAPAGQPTAWESIVSHLQILNTQDNLTNLPT